MTRWYKEKKREHYYKEAKKHGYRARSAYKLKQIQNRYHLFHPGDTIIDLGAAPGGWSQVASEYVGSDGFIVGIDLSYIPPLSGVHFLQGDATQKQTIEQLQVVLETREVDIVLSDMSPNISGNYSMDHARSIHLCVQSLEIATQLLRENGSFVCKIFMGESLEEFIDDVSTHFTHIKRFSPPASRKSSSEIYLIAKHFKKD